MSGKKIFTIEVYEEEAFVTGTIQMILSPKILNYINMLGFTHMQSLNQKEADNMVVFIATKEN